MTTQNFIKYKSGYKYQLFENYFQNLNIHPEKTIIVSFIVLEKDGDLHLEKGYAWNGTSGPVKDNQKNMRASLVHDALYQLMRMGLLDISKHRKPADKLFQSMCKEDGVNMFCASLFFKALRLFGKKASSPESMKMIKRAPR